MEDFTRRSTVRRALLTLGVAQVLIAQSHPGQSADTPDDVHLPNGKLQRDAILKEDYEHSLKDARDLIDLTKSFELDLEKSDANVLSLDLLKKLDDIEKITKRIRGRMRH